MSTQNTDTPNWVPAYPEDGTTRHVPGDEVDGSILTEAGKWHQVYKPVTEPTAPVVKATRGKGRIVALVLLVTMLLAGAGVAYKMTRPDPYKLGVECGQIAKVTKGDEATKCMDDAFAALHIEKLPDAPLADGESIADRMDKAIAKSPALKPFMEGYFKAAFDISFDDTTDLLDKE
jgi:hypothetical protein